jgi:hypothetical protein
MVFGSQENQVGRYQWKDLGFGDLGLDVVVIIVLAESSSALAHGQVRSTRIARIIKFSQDSHLESRNWRCSSNSLLFSRVERIV